MSWTNWAFTFLLMLGSGWLKNISVCETILSRHCNLGLISPIRWNKNMCENVRRWSS